jgi:hypothetical protein
LAHREFLLHFACARPEGLPFVEDGLKASIGSAVQGVDALLQPLTRPFGDDRGRHAFAPLARALNLAPEFLARSLNDRRPPSGEPLPELRSDALGLRRRPHRGGFGVGTEP